MQAWRLGNQPPAHRDGESPAKAPRWISDGEPPQDQLSRIASTAVLARPPLVHVAADAIPLVTLGTIIGLRINCAICDLLVGAGNDV